MEFIESLGIGYFDVSYAIVWTMAIIFIPTFVYRLLKAFPYYVKNGDVGKDHSLMFAYWGEKQAWVNLFTIPNPASVLTDFVTICGVALALWMAWIIVPAIFAAWLIYKGITGAAKRAREHYLKKQEFVAKLKGDNV